MYFIYILYFEDFCLYLNLRLHAKKIICDCSFNLASWLITGINRKLHFGQILIVFL